MDYFEEVKKGKAFKGKFSLIKHLEGKIINKRQAIEAKCYDCMGFYNDGTIDCEIQDCPLYPFMPFQKNVIRKNKRIISEETKGKMKKSLEKARLRKMEGKRK